MIRIPMIGWNCRNGSVSFESAVMNYVSFGSGPRTVLILPGLSDGLTTVKGKAVLLSAPYRHYFSEFTIYMFSRKDPLPDGTSIRDMACDTAKAMDLLGIGSASVLGVSQGGMIAQVLAAEFPGKVEKLVLAVTAGKCGEISKERLDSWIGYARNNDHKGLMIDTAENSYSDRYLEKYRRIYPVIGLIGKPKNYSRFLINASSILTFDASDLLEKIVCPTLIIGGGKDRIVGIEASRQLHERIRGSEFFEYPDLGHAAYEEAADFNHRVFSFLGGGSDE